MRAVLRVLSTVTVVALSACTLPQSNPSIRDESLYPTLPPRDTALMVNASQQLIEGGHTREAYALLTEAQEYEDGEAFQVKARLYEGGQGVSPVPFIARDYYWMGALNGNAESMYQVALRRLETGHADEALLWMERAAQQQHLKANFWLAQKAFQDHQNAQGKRYLSVALNGRLPEAQWFLAESLEKGTNGYDQDYKQAFMVYDALAQLEDAKAMHAIGYYFARGLHGVKDPVAAVHWYHEAAKRGYADAMEAYAWMVENGVGTVKDSSEARWYRKLAERQRAYSVEGAL